MATHIISSTLSNFFLQASLLCLCLLCSTYGDQLSNNHVVSVSSLLPPTVCNRTTLPWVSGKATLEVISKYGPCSPLNQGKANTPSWEEILRRDQLRVDLRNSRLFQNSDPDYLNQTKAISFPANIKEKMADLYYIIVALGEPKQYVSLVLDTGSDLTWTQCKPCIGSCFKQRDPIYDPFKSKTYANIPCNSQTCNLLVDADINPACSYKKCSYSIGYADGSNSIGFFSTEKLTITNGVASLVLNNFMFGCANNNTGDASGASGIMGLDRSPVSIITQTSEKYFSYCLPSTYGSTGYITFGKNDNVTNKFIKFTPVFTISQQPELYGILITGISVDGIRLPIRRSVFTRPQSIIDSGAVITRLPPAAYSALRLAFRRKMSEYKMISPYSLFDTCYDFSSYDTVTIPKITFHFFGDVDFDLDVRGILVIIAEGGGCLAFVGNSDETDTIYFGNVQQRGYEWHYDVAGRRVGFGPGSCS